MTQPTGDNRDLQLPGYTLVNRIGAGGYGEVWLANAPGGLTKAVKFIFGYHNEKRASRELHSLEKIKAVRHPFLLSLERIEVIEGRLVIVTELADASLKDRFDACLQEGKPGIPREELLCYLRDTADALDYLSNEHSLQHLDVKPENLLLLAGHIKVADFGLVKEIQDTQASLVGGMTPLYSAPEVFQGHPSSFSDQYSLAIVYQEMLVGKLPFSAVTSAELTLQHMHDEPDLSSLPMTDRYVLARALSKDPKQRYPSCGEMVHALLASESEQTETQVHASFSNKPVSAAAHRTPSATPTATRPGAITQVFEEDLVDEDAVSKSMLLEMPIPIQSDAAQLSPLDLTPEGFQPTPTLVIGIGGTAGRVLGQLRQRLNSRYGQGGRLPAMQMLLLDTDPKAISEATRGDAETGLQNEETLTLALRRPQEYREHSTRLLRWLSRRWLYNIPKSLRTEGLRPLGRLALADHSRRVLQRIRLALSQAVDRQSIAESSECLGMPLRDQAVRVYVVASISGGTGSGMSLDVGYAVKTVLEKLGISEASTLGVFMHSTGRDSRYCDLAKVNAYSWLTEFNHFNQPEGFYPGDLACGLPAQEKGVPVLDHSYLVHLGSGLTDGEFAEKTEMVADYLYLDAMTPAQTFFEASRNSSPQSTDHTTLRTFGLHRVSAAPESTLKTVAAALCHRIVLGWAGSETSQPETETISILTSEAKTTSVSETNQLVCGTAQAVAQMQINLEGIAANSRSMIEGQFGNQVEQLLEKLLTQVPETGQPATATEILQVIDGMFAPPVGTDPSEAAFVLQRPLEAIVSPLGMKLTANLQKWILCRLDDRQERLLGTQSSSEWFTRHFQRVEAETQRMIQSLRGQLAAMAHCDESAHGNGPKEDPADNACLESAIRYFRLQVDLRALQATAHLTRMLQAELTNIRETVVEFGRHLRHLAESLGETPTDPRLTAQNQMFSAKGPAPQPDELTELLLSNLSEHAVTVDQQLQEAFIDPQGGLFETVMSNGRVLSELMATMKTLAGEHVQQLARQLSMADGASSEVSFAKHVAEATPPLLSVGGVANHLALLPQEKLSAAQATQLRSAFECEISTLTGSDDLIVCCESGQLPLLHTAMNLIQCRRDYAEFAARVHTRNDIDWTPLLDIQPKISESSCELATQVL